MGRMTVKVLLPLLLGWFWFQTQAGAQERIKLDYSSVDASNAVWYTAQEVGLFKKNGLDSELIFIPSTTTAVSSIIAGDIPIGNASGGGVASAVVGGANLVMVACMLNTLPYELVVQESIKTAEDLRGKNIGISRIGSASDVAARALIRGLGLEPEKQVLIMQVGGPAERAASFRAGRIVGFPSTPGIIHLTQGMPFKILISTADFPKRFDFPYICATTTKSYLSRQRDTVRKVLMAHIEAVQFFKTRKEETIQILRKYSRVEDRGVLEHTQNWFTQNMPEYPYPPLDGYQVVLQEMVSSNPKAAALNAKELIDTRFVKELDDSGFVASLGRK